MPYKCIVPEALLESRDSSDDASTVNNPKNEGNALRCALSLKDGNCVCALSYFFGWTNAPA